MHGALEQVRLLVERTVLEDVDLDAGQDAKRREPFVDIAHDVELLAQPLDAIGEPLAAFERVADQGVSLEALEDGSRLVQRKLERFRPWL